MVDRAGVCGATTWYGAGLEQTSAQEQRPASPSPAHQRTVDPFSFFIFTVPLAFFTVPGTAVRMRKNPWLNMLISGIYWF